MGDKRNPKYNQSGCADPTAYEAIGRVIKEEAKLNKKARTLITVLKFIIHETGFELLNNIEIKDKKTGRRFRYTLRERD